MAFPVLRGLGPLPIFPLKLAVSIPQLAIVMGRRAIGRECDCEGPLATRMYIPV